MARAVCTVWTFFAILVSATGLAPEDIGVNWGSQTSHPLLPSIVAGMLKDNGIKKLKLFDADPWIVSAFAGTGIELMVGIANNQLKDLSDSYGNAKDWVKHNVSKHIRDGGVDIRFKIYIYIVSEE